MGSHIMRQRLKGASVASYYPPRIGTIAQLRSLYPENELLDEEEEDWLEHLNVARSRGKSVPKKKRTAAGKSLPGYTDSQPGADHMQNRRSSTRGNKWTYATRHLVLGHCKSIVQASIKRRFIWRTKRKRYTGLYASIATINDFHEPQLQLCCNGWLHLALHSTLNTTFDNSPLLLEFIIPR